MRDPLDSAITTARRVPPINWTGVPVPLRGHVSAVCRSVAECEDLVAWYGDPDFCPFHPVLLLIPGHQPVAIVGDGYATAAELRDCAVVAWETKAGKAFDFETAREKAGLPEASKFDELVREALWERAKKHIASPVTDPMRQPTYANPTGRIVFAEHPGVPYEIKRGEA